MKKRIAVLLICVMVLGLCACGQQIDEETQTKLDLYDKYENYITMLENEEYEALLWEITAWYQEQQATAPTEPAPPEPTDEEEAQLREYRRMVEYLKNIDSADYTVDDHSISVYDENGQWVDSYSGQAALNYVYQKLQELTVADNWTEWLQERYGEEYNWNRQEHLAKFTVGENVLLKQVTTYTDNMGNVSTGWSNPAWKYDEEGKVIKVSYPNDVFELTESNPLNISDTAWYTYDESGRVTQIRYGGESSTSYLVTVTYEDTGKAEHVVCNDGETDIYYTYDGKGRLSQITWKPITDSGTSNAYYLITYTYDDNHNMVRAEKVYYGYTTSYDNYGHYPSKKWIWEYTYDANGHLTAGTYTYEDWYIKYNTSTNPWTVFEYLDSDKQNQYTFTCDDQGRVLTQSIVYGDQYYRHGDSDGKVEYKSDYATGIVEFTYADYIYYTEAE